MSDHVRRPLRAVAAGFATAAVGGTGLFVALASPASAHEGTEPDKPKGDYDCPAIAEFYELDVDWTQFVIDEFPAEEGDYDYVLSDRGTPDDDSDDAVITITVTGPKNFDWTSNVGIDAIAVAGEDTQQYATHVYYYDGDELTEDVDYSSAPYSEPHTNPIATITVCWDDENPGTTTTSSSSTTSSTTSTTAPSSTSSSSSAPPTSDTTATTAPSSTVTTAPSTTTTTGEELPNTGSNSTMMLVGIGTALLAAGAGLVFATRRYWHRTA